MIEALLVFVGFGLVCIVDTAWKYIDYSKAEKGMEAHEHYHVGLELIIIAVITFPFIPYLSWILIGAGFTFFASEWMQEHWTKDGKVVPGHPFAYGSTHFRTSCIIGIALVIILGIVSSFFLV